MLLPGSDTESLTAIAAVVSSITALVALIVGPLLALYVAKRQIIATTISTERKEWVASLRQSIVGFVATISSVLNQQSLIQTLDPAWLKSKSDELVLFKAQIFIFL